MHNDIYMLWLSSMVAQIGSHRLNSILEIFGTARDAFFVKTEEIHSRVAFSDAAEKIFAQNHNLQYIENLLTNLHKLGIVYYPRDSERFPALLREIPDPPLGLFCIGELPPDNTHKVAVIGSRNCSDYGLMAARVLSKPLAEAGVVIVSGMARGVDSMAHRGAIEGGGKTIAVLGCGVDICYPLENRKLRDEIIANGCIVSEYPPGTRPERFHFPARNRIISGLSHGVVVTEAAERSGTLITVNQAADQGREVFAVPGNISSRLSEGTNRLISDGAIPVSTHNDILFHLGISPTEKNFKIDPVGVTNRIKKTKGEHPGSDTTRFKKNIAPAPLTIETSNAPSKEPSNAVPKKILAPEEKQVYDSLSFEPTSIDTLMETTGLPPGRVLFVCAQLEIAGIIKKTHGSRYIKV